MATDSIVMLSVFGGLFLLNAISLILVWTTSYGKDWIFDTMSTSTKGFFIFWNFYMLIVGITFWIAALFDIIRYGKRDYSKFKNVTPKQLVQMLEVEWAKNKEAEKNRKVSNC